MRSQCWPLRPLVGVLTIAEVPFLLQPTLPMAPFATEEGLSCAQTPVQDPSPHLRAILGGKFHQRQFRPQHPPLCKGLEEEFAPG